MDNYVQYGCGLCAPEGWQNFDASPTLRIQKLSIFGNLVKSRLNVVFPANVFYGDIIKGLPIKMASAHGVFCSHILEHLSLHDLRVALSNTLAVLEPGGIFRCVVPDLEFYSRRYIKSLDEGEVGANYKFIGPSGEVLFGVEKRRRGLTGLLEFLLGNSHHLWMWDFQALAAEFEKAGFVKIRRCSYNDSLDKMFQVVEDPNRFSNALAIEAFKPF